MASRPQGAGATTDRSPVVQTYALIANPRPGLKTRRARLRTFLSALTEVGVECRPYLVTRKSDPREAARLALSEGATVLIAAGGDGTVNAVASVALEANVPLGILPAGTLNHFARDLRIPLDLALAAQTIASGRTTRVDIAELNGRPFLNNSSLGLYPRIAFWRERQRRLRRRSRTVSLILATLRALWRMPIVHIRLHATGVEIRRSTPLVMIGNNKYELSGTHAGTRNSLTDGLLSLYIAKVTTRLGMLALAARTILGLHREEHMESLSVTEAWMETRKKQVRVALDGEVSLVDSPMHFRVRPGALEVFTP